MLSTIDWENILQLFVSAFLGAAIGTEREFRNRSAGFRTHILVSMGACLIMIISSDAFPDLDTDPTRIAAQVVSGIGFLGAGSIMQNKNEIRGLTTAANIWVCGAIGLAVGAGMYSLAISATIIVLLVLTIISSAVKKFYQSFSESIRLKSDEIPLDESEIVIDTEVETKIKTKSNRDVRESD